MIISEYVNIFGYGSLVNRRTRPHELAATPVRVRNWRRSWSHCVETELGKVCALTIAPHGEAEVAGVVVPEHRDGLSGLDAREKGYERIRFSLVADKPQISPAQGCLETFPYVSP